MINKFLAIFRMSLYFFATTFLFNDRQSIFMYGQMEKKGNRKLLDWPHVTRVTLYSFIV